MWVHVVVGLMLIVSGVHAVDWNLQRAVNYVISNGGACDDAADCAAPRYFNKTIGDFDTSGVTDMGSLFSYKTTFNGDISKWDTSSVTTMYSMFQNARAFNQPIGNWDTSSVTSMSLMFLNAEAFDQDVTNWTFPSSANPSMFTNSKMYSSETVDLCSSHSQFCFSLYEAVGHAIDDNNTKCVGFSCGIWKDVHISEFNTTGVTNMNSIFNDKQTFNVDISKWDTSSVTSMQSMFLNAHAFNQPIGNWDTSSVTSMNSMFYYAKAFDQDITNWTFPSSANPSMFNGSPMYSSETVDLCSSHSQFCFSIKDAVGHALDNSGVCVGFSCGIWKDKQISDFNTTGVTDMSYAFYYKPSFDADISKWDTSSVTTMAYMFYNGYSSNQPLSLPWDFRNIRPSIPNDVGGIRGTFYSSSTLESEFNFTGSYFNIPTIQTGGDLWWYNYIGRPCPTTQTCGSYPNPKWLYVKAEGECECQCEGNNCCGQNEYRSGNTCEACPANSIQTRSGHRESDCECIDPLYEKKYTDKLITRGNLSASSYTELGNFHCNVGENSQTGYELNDDTSLGVQKDQCFQFCVTHGQNAPDANHSLLEDVDFSWVSEDTPMKSMHYSTTKCYCNSNPCNSNTTQGSGNGWNAYSLDVVNGQFPVQVFDGCEKLPDVDEFVVEYDFTPPSTRCPLYYRQMTQDECQQEANKHGKGMGAIELDTIPTGCSRTTNYYYNTAGTSNNDDFGDGPYDETSTSNVALCKLAEYTIHEAVAEALVEGTCTNPLCGIWHNKAISDFDTSGVTDMSFLFANEENFNADLSGWDTSSVTNMDAMFRNAIKYEANIGDWDTSNVVSMKHIFENVKSVDASVAQWDVSGVTC